jgi:glycosyltransferase involved in cell wall biosynthesis
MLPLSVFIITKNEEARLPRTLESVAEWAGEIVVVDSGSSDRTVEIAKAYEATVIHRQFVGYGNQKLCGERKCRYDWVLNIDADEVVTTDLRAEIELLFSGELPEPSAYKIRILNVYPGDEHPRFLANDYNIVRLYHRSVASYRDHPVFDRVEVDGTSPKQLKGVIHRHPHVSLRHAIEKLNTFSDFRAQKSQQRSIIALKARMLFEFPIVFAKMYFFLRHCFGGWKGLYFSLCQAFMRTSRIAKMIESAQRAS